MISPDYDTYDDDGIAVTDEFGALIDCFIEEKMKVYSSVELEAVLIEELMRKFSEHRFLRNVKKSRNKRS